MMVVMVKGEERDERFVSDFSLLFLIFFFFFFPDLSFFSDPAASLTPLHSSASIKPAL